MLLNDTELAELAARASTLTERIDGTFSPVGLAQNETQNEALIQERMANWFERATGRDETLFQRRMAWDSLSPEAALNAIGNVSLSDGTPLPDWVMTLNDLFAYIGIFSKEQFSAKTQLEINRVLIPEAPLPFEDILFPMVCYAWDQLQITIPLSESHLSKQAQADLARQLMWRLSRVCTTPLMGELAWLRTQDNPLSLFAAKRTPTGSSALYQQLVRDMLDGKLKTFLLEYAFLARLIVTTITRWIVVTEEFIRRLEQDRVLFSDTFNADMTQVASIETDLSDMHNGMRSVYSLTFTSGAKLVYKPKRVQLDQLFQNFIAWLNPHLDSLQLKTFTVLDRDDYGWMQFVEHAPCRDEDAVAAYYHRVGMLLCIQYALNGTDCHIENIIAWGEHPILIDLETLIMPRVNTMIDGVEDIVALATAPMRDSVLFTGMLPDWHSANNGDAYNSGGLGSKYTDGETAQLQLWQHINTDDMVFGPVTVNTSPPGGMPFTQTDTTVTYHDATGYLNSILAGFEEMYRTLLSLRDDLLKVNNPLYRLSTQSTRFIFRATESYGLLMNRVIHPRFLRSGIEWSLELEALCRPMLGSTQKNPFWSMIRSEQEAISRLDIPLFNAEMTGCDLVTDLGEQVENAFSRSGHDALRTKLEKLSPADLQQQIMFIQSAFDAFNAFEGNPTSADISVLNEKSNATVQQPLSPEAAIRHAVEIGETLKQRALTVSASSTNWINIGFLGDCHRYRLEAMGDTLYEGLTGVGLFLAALECSVGGYRELALGAVHNIRSLIHQPDRLAPMLAKMPIGAGSGLASMVYALAKMSQFLQMPELLHDASVLAEMITPELIEADTYYDVIAGSAGAILGLLSLYALKPDAILLDRAILCGQHLVNSRVVTESGARAWPNSDGVCLAGFSHGAGGISYALLRLYALTQDSALLNAASEAIDYERSLFMPEFGNWADLRTPEDSGLMTSWCHGAPGIGLARIGGLAAFNTPEIQRDIEVALATTQHSLWSDVDHLCCGMFGKLDVLLTAGSRLDRPDLLANTYGYANWIVEQASAHGGYRTLAELPRHTPRLGLFQGLSGIGYQLLRFARPEQLPSLLLWE